MRHLLKILTVSCFFISACSPDGGIGEGFSTQDQEVLMVPTYTPPPSSPPTIYKEDQYEVIHGATRHKDLSVTYSADIRRMVLRGEIELNPISSRGMIRVPVDLAGIADEDGYVYLKNYDPRTPQIPGLKMGAKATCIGENLSCASSFIDIYLEFEGKIYHHQVESLPVTNNQKGEVNDDRPETGDHADDHVEEAEVHEEHETEEEVAHGRYVGTLDQDIEEIFKQDPVTPEIPKDDSKEPPKKDEPKPEQPKTETPKAETPAKTPPTKPTNNNQAIGATNNGKLQKAVDLLALEKSLDNPGFKVLRPERLTHFATSELATLIRMMGDFTKKAIPNAVLYLGDASREKGGIWYRGGKAWGHVSHQNGLDLDVPLFFNVKSMQGYFASALKAGKAHPNWMKEQQWDMFKMLTQTQMIDRIFIHHVLKKSLCEMAIKNGELVKGRDSLASETLRRLRPDKDHHNHFHMRIKCSKSQTLCKRAIEPAKDSGCF